MNKNGSELEEKICDFADAHRPSQLFVWDFPASQLSLARIASLPCSCVSVVTDGFCPNETINVELMYGSHSLKRAFTCFKWISKLYSR